MSQAKSLQDQLNDALAVITSLQKQVTEQAQAPAQNTGRCIVRKPLEGTIAGVLQREREKQGMQQKELAGKTGVESGYISAIETGRNSNPTLKACVALARGLGYPLSEMLRRLENEAPEKYLPPNSGPPLNLE